ncbi:TetR/AcrR family transcriptional regulator [Geodermatophilus sp. YIM 151500]|uniref:TetR/AcrR family transcriptional regulator n=1 Tax=Geodermatophilus sp. YIM 151500 TaxID=2984531 RepID=UPI0021E4D6B2|nr:TetR/AcrR family transcriptional regulator [Geodermatophilus sp. YIM 151500]MCV2488306.1 TetR/AcrR family transcriptional regulator [Geodermatophilus sp. YIM 151500]
MPPTSPGATAAGGPTRPPAGAGVAAPPTTLPTTERGRRQRERLLAAARVVFERDGFLDARVTDISAEAGVAHGSFYTYFGSKTAVFRALLAATMDELYDTLRVGTADSGAPTADAPAPAGTRSAEEAVRRVERANRRFVAMYRENTALMALFEQVTTFDPEVRALRQAARERMVGRVRHSIEQLQTDGLVAADLDAEYSAHALVAMVSGLVHYWLVLDGDFEEERLVATLTRLWTTSLGLAPTPTV